MTRPASLFRGKRRLRGSERFRETALRDRFGGSFWDSYVKSKHKSMNGLQQGIVQISRDFNSFACPLAEAFSKAIRKMLHSQ